MFVNFKSFFLEESSNIKKFMNNSSETSENRSIDEMKNAEDFSNEVMNNNFHNKIIWIFQGKDNFNKMKLSKQLEQLTIQDIKINEILEQETDSVADYMLEIDNLDKELAILEQQEQEVYNEKFNKYTELTEKNEKQDLTESEKNELQDVAKYVLNYNGGEFKDKKGNINNSKNSVKNKIFSINIENHIDKANGYIYKTNSVANDLKKKDSEANTDDAKIAVDNLNDTIYKYKNL